MSWEFLTAAPREGMRAGGIWPALVGTIYLTVGTGIIAVPLGLAAAVYLAEYARDSAFTEAIPDQPSSTWRESLRSSTACSGWLFFVLFLKLGSSIAAACLTLSIMTLPVIISTAEEALRTVPESFRLVPRGWEGPAGRASARWFYPRRFLGS